MPKWVLVALYLFMQPLLGGGASILEVQGMLRDLGYQPGVVDGLWGGKTSNALKQFQADHAIPGTGKINDETVTTLRESIKAKNNPPVQPEPAQSNTEVVPVAPNPTNIDSTASQAEIQVEDPPFPEATPEVTPVITDPIPVETAQESTSTKIEIPEDQASAQQTVADVPTVPTALDASIEPPVTTQDTPSNAAVSTAILQPTAKWQGTVITSPAGIKFLRIPGGCFTANNDGFASSQQEVCVHKNSSFLLGQYEITQAQWQAVMGNNPSTSKKGENYPVESISWNDTQDFITKLNATGQGHYRLPTEAEWEYAARGGGNTMYWWGNIAPICKPGQPNGANFSGGASCPNATTPIGTYAANPFGLYDMHGNVWEWVQDIYLTSGYNPKHKNDPVVTKGGTSRVFRGGSWLYPADAMIVFNRDRAPQVFRFSHLGLRLVYEPND